MKLETEVLKALGLGDNVRSLTLRFEVDQPPLVTAEFVLLDQSSADGFVTELHNYELVER